MQELRSLFDVEIGQEIGQITATLHDMRGEAPEEAKATPLDGPCSITDQVSDWARRPPDDPRQLLTDLDQHLDRMDESLDGTQKVIRAAAALEGVSSLSYEALDRVAESNGPEAHALIRRMIEMLQGAARDVRGIQFDRSEPER